MTYYYPRGHKFKKCTYTPFLKRRKNVLKQIERRYRRIKFKKCTYSFVKKEQKRFETDREGVIDA